jgi:hypothetical protein
MKKSMWVIKPNFEQYYSIYSKKIFTILKLKIFFEIEKPTDNAIAFVVIKIRFEFWEIQVDFWHIEWNDWLCMEYRLDLSFRKSMDK